MNFDETLKHYVEEKGLNDVSATEEEDKESDGGDDDAKTQVVKKPKTWRSMKYKCPGCGKKGNIPRNLFRDISKTLNRALIEKLKAEEAKPVTKPLSILLERIDEQKPSTSTISTPESIALPEFKVPDPKPKVKRVTRSQTLAPIEEHVASGSSLISLPKMKMSRKSTTRPIGRTSNRAKSMDADKSGRTVDIRSRGRTQSLDTNRKRKINQSDAN